MHPIVVLGILALIAVLFFASRTLRRPGASSGPILTRTLVGVGIAVLVVLTLTGRLHWLFTLIGVGIPVLLRIIAAGRLLRSARGPTPGQTSDVTTRFLRMTLDHDSGTMRGEVLEGTHRGRSLEDLTLEEIVALLWEYRREDQESADLLESYLERTHGDAWREGNDGAGPGGTGGVMTRDEAMEILGLAGEPSEEEIVDAHRRLMQKLHPDRGGSDYLASQVNRAKDVLLG